MIQTECGIYCILSNQPVSITKTVEGLQKQQHRGRDSFGISYLKSNNQNTLQSIIRHKKNKLLDNLGKADITSHVNFSLLSEFFNQHNLKIKKIITQKEFLENMGIIERAKIIAEKMKFTEKSDLYLRVQRLLSPRYMGELFKVILAYKFDNNNFAGFK